MRIPGISRPIANIAALLAVCALAVSVFTFVLIGASREEALRTAEAVLSREAGVAGERLDGVFRAAGLVLSVLARDADDLSEYSQSVPEASNFLILDAEGRPIKTSYPRPRLSPIRSPLLEKLKAGSRFESGSVAVLFESERVLAMMIRRESKKGDFAGAACAVFTDRLFDDAVASLLGTAVDSLYLQDSDGSALLQRSLTDAPPNRTGSSLIGSYQLRSMPLRVFVVAKKDAFPAPSNSVRLAVAVSSFILFAFSTLSAIYAHSMDRAAIRSAEMARELERRDALFKEVNHRVKNDLQIVRSVISLGRACVGSECTEADYALQAAENRINSISLVHEQLYKHAAAATIDLGSYMKDLAAYLADAYGADRPVRVVSRAEPDLALTMDAAVPCGLLLNELVTNAFKYAFPNAASGTIALTASRWERDGIELRVEDDGVGFSADPESRRAGSFGLDLIKTLAAQLGASLRREGGPGKGTRWVIALPPSGVNRSAASKA